MVFATNNNNGRSGSIAEQIGGDFDNEDEMRIYNPSKLKVPKLKTAAGAESMTISNSPGAPANRATLNDLPVQPPGSPSRFTFPPSPPAVERRAMSEDDRIAAIVARALQQMETSKAAAAVQASSPAVQTFEAFLESVHLPAVPKKTERDERTLATRRLFERVGFCSGCRISWRLELSPGENCPRCCAPRTKSPGIDLVDSAALNCLAASLVDDDGNPATAGKRLRYLMAILNDAAERGLIRKVKKPKVRQSETLIRTLSDVELVALYKAAAGATWPRHDQFTPRAFWEAFVVLMVLYGFRLGELLSLPWFEAAAGKKLARGVHPGELCPRPELRNLGLISERGWLVYLPPKQALAKPLPLVLPLHAMAADHLDAIRGDRRFVFDVYSELKTKSPGDYRDVKVSIYRQWNALCDAAGFTDELRATPHDLRRTQETRYDLQLGKGTGGEVNGHAARSVSETYYSQAIPRIHRAVLSVSLPQFSP